MSSLPSLPKCPSEEDLAQTLGRWRNQAQRFVEEVKGLADDVEVSLRHQSLYGWRFSDQQLQPLVPPPQGECYVRVF